MKILAPIRALDELEMLAAPGTHARQNLPYLSSIERLDDFADYRDESWRRRAWFLTERALWSLTEPALWSLVVTLLVTVS